MVTICVDTPGWFDPFAERLAEQTGAKLVRSTSDVPEGDVAFYLSCCKLTPPGILARNACNIVVHASALPEGRGFSPLVWQVLEGRNEIPISMIHASDEADTGNIVMRDTLVFKGHELNGEMRTRLGEKIVEMCLAFLADPSTGEPQQGEPSWYPRRRPADSRLDPDKTIAQQFDLLRVVDNERYPAFFEHRGHRYKLLIEREE